MNDKPAVIPGNPGSARVEYFACREDVEAMLAKGYAARMVYEHMQEQGRVMCSYSAFCDYVRGQGKHKHSKGKRRFPLRPDTPSTPNTPSMVFFLSKNICRKIIIYYVCQRTDNICIKI